MTSALVLPRFLVAQEQKTTARQRVPDRGLEPASNDRVATYARARLKLAETQRVWRDAISIAPTDARQDSLGESVRDFHGFGVSVVSVPSDAQVLVNGTEAGVTPLVASVTCEPGDPVAVDVRKKSYAPERSVTTCRADTLVDLVVQLRRPKR